MGYFRIIALFLKDLVRLLTGIGKGRWSSKFLGYLFGMASMTLGGMVVKLLQFFGLTLAINTIATPLVLPYMVGPITGLPAEWQSFLAMAHVDRAITILVSAMAISVSQRIRLKPSNPSLWS
ncbi:DUF2523 family protein [Lysobacter sp.]|uniref:DUF2523 family protein n=1 Tax=Lysobacter sp. TaxID=72226 RepID=UPI002D47414D|nr:DUF2523 family protein [Lysobacter sp.]HZX76822.1 DUF2523 family protein [Lysobacter sp.]